MLCTRGQLSSGQRSARDSISAMSRSTAPPRGSGCCLVALLQELRLEQLPEARPEAALLLALSVQLLGEDVHEGDHRDVAEVDDDLAEQPAAVLLLGERRVELGAGEETLLDQQLAETARRRRRSGCLRYRCDVVVQQARCGALRRRLGLRRGLHPIFLMPELDRP